MRRVPIYLGHEHPCSYLPGKVARSLFVAPDPTALNTSAYSSLAQHGFRRSGDMVYKPHCQSCDACTPIRIPVERFVPNRSQGRIWRRNSELEIRSKPCEFEEIHYLLFRKYLAARHADGGMADSERNDYLDFLACTWGETRFVEFRAGKQLIAVAVVDVLDDGLSAVYTFYDPTLQSRSPGVFAVLWQIAEARRLNLSWLYLGFWIGDCQKMAYKNQYRPLQALIGQNWREFQKDEAILGADMV